MAMVARLILASLEWGGEKMSYAKGPWKAASDYQPLLIVSSDKKRVADCTPALGASNSEAFANAQLIAAAPDLLEALQSLMERYIVLAASGDCGHWNPEEEKVIIRAKAAIAKAKAEAPNE